MALGNIFIKMSQATYAQTSFKHIESSQIGREKASSGSQIQLAFSNPFFFVSGATEDFK